MSEVRDLFRKDLAEAMAPDADAAAIMARWIGVEIPMEPCDQYTEGVEVLRAVRPDRTLEFDRRYVLRERAEFVSFHFRKDGEGA
jgi:hypothetical protein